MADVADYGLVSGEGVLIDARPASFSSRALSAIIDATALLLVGLGGLWVAGNWLGGLTQQWSSAGFIAAVAALLIAIPTLIETLTRGYSLGKWMTGIRIVRDDGGAIGFRHALIRALLGVGELWLTAGSAALIVSLASAKGKRIGDALAGTYALRVRGAKDLTADLVLPPNLAHWAKVADLAPLPDGLALEVRHYLLRADGLAPVSREKLGRELAARVAGYVSPRPPPGTTDADFLTAVLLLRRERDVSQLQRRRDLVGALGPELHALPYGIPDPPI